MNKYLLRFSAAEFGIYVDKEGKEKDFFIEFSLYGCLTKAFDSDTEDDDIGSSSRNYWRQSIRLT